MKKLKRTLSIAIAIMVMVVSTTATYAATPSPKKVELSTATAASAIYNGKNQTPVIKVTAKVNGKEVVLKENVDYKVVSVTKSYVNAGTYKVTVEGIGKYTGTKTITYVINSVKNPAKVTAASKGNTVQIKITKKAKKSKVTYSTSKTSKKLKKYIKVNKKGKVTFKKNAPKGKYKVTITIRKKNYKTVKKTVIIRRK